MRHILHVLSIVALLVLKPVVFPFESIRAQQTFELDLTGPYPDEPPGRSPERGIRTGSDKPVRPAPPRPAIKLQILQIEPNPVRRDDRIRVRFTIRNLGPEPFDLPIGTDFKRVYQDGNEDRRVAFFFLTFGVNEASAVKEIMAMRAGSVTVAGSLLALAPGDEVIVSADSTMVSYSSEPLIPSEQDSASVRAGYSEFAIKNDAFVVDYDSVDILSDDSIVVTFEK